MIIKRNFYARRDYDSVDEKNQYIRLCPEKREKIIQGIKGNIYNYTGHFG